MIDVEISIFLNTFADFRRLLGERRLNEATQTQKLSLSSNSHNNLFSKNLD